MPRASSSDNPQRSLPEVSVNPHIQSPVQQSDEQSYEPAQNGFANGRMHSSGNENHFVTHLNIEEKRTNHSKHPPPPHHHIQVEPAQTFKRTGVSLKQHPVADVEPSATIQRSTTGSINIVVPSTKDSLNEAYLDRDHVRTQSSTPVNAHAHNDSTSTLKYHERRTSLTPPPSPATQELNRIWKKQRNKYASQLITNVPDRRTTKSRRPSGRLKHYEDETETETTATETQSKDEGSLKNKHRVIKRIHLNSTKSYKINLSTPSYSSQRQLEKIPRHHERTREREREKETI